MDATGASAPEVVATLQPPADEGGRPRPDVPRRLIADSRLLTSVRPASLRMSA